jgi:hypothetical protein|tara:strand:+ start:3059 stop:3475 length:417 start_codon:yes stop_codon:yes gene_type:complete
LLISDTINKQCEVFGIDIVYLIGKAFNCLNSLNLLYLKYVMGPIKFTIIKKLKGNNRFNYTPRYYKGKEEISEGKHATKIDAYADTFNESDFSGQWKNVRLKSRNRNNGAFNSTILIIIAVLILLFLYIIDFDLSIFY